MLKTTYACYCSILMDPTRLVFEHERIVLPLGAVSVFAK